MTAKRFIIPKGYRVIKDNVTDECATFYDNDDGETFLKWLNELHEENEQLKERNNRQTKQLDRLYSLIAKKDWRTLSDIMDDFKKAEEQLQRESGIYW